MVEWQTRRTQNPVGATLWGFKSPLRHQSIPNFSNLSASASRSRRVKVFHRGHRRFTAEQNSYRWYILAASFLILDIDGGVRFSFGVLIKPLASEFSWERVPKYPKVSE